MLLCTEMPRCFLREREGSGEEIVRTFIYLMQRSLVTLQLNTNSPADRRALTLALIRVNTTLILEIPENGSKVQCFLNLCCRERTRLSSGQVSEGAWSQDPIPTTVKWAGTNAFFPKGSKWARGSSEPGSHE